SKLCHTMVFANSPEAKTFRVLVVRHLDNGVAENQAYMQTGDSFDGPLQLGTTDVHDDSTGTNLNVNVVYKVDSYIAAKARADADCPPPHAIARPVPKRPSPQPAHT
ncbi:MAG: hypothetical protein JOY69_03050, partial [Candidatus Eremiobacteraeota bacterium]|nr:hypothetical protein [Candidatus Eremiobacteraeota bacterium]